MESNNISFKDIEVINIEGEKKTIGDYLQNKKALVIVNVASACGYTDSNYKELASLYEEYGQKGLEILGFPCNQFGAQESKCELDIKKFSKTKYNVTFPMFSKIEVNGENSHPLYVFLKKLSPDFNQNPNNLTNIPWNFSKFLINSKGELLGYYSHKMSPMKMKADIEKALI